CWTGWWPNTTRSDAMSAGREAGTSVRGVRWHDHHDGNRILPVAATAARACASHADRKIARARLARGRKGGLRGGGAEARRGTVGRSRRELSPGRYLARGRGERATDPAHARRR